jgi:peptidyl-prolyl cis-trans isomerase C
MKKIVYLTVFIVLMVFVSCQDDNYAARVGNYVIKIQEVKSSFGDRKNTSIADFDAILSQVNSLVDKKLTVIGAIQEGLENDSTVLARIAEMQDKQVYSYMIQKDVISKVVTPKMMRQKYKQQSREWHLRHIFFPLKQKQSQSKIAILTELSTLRGRLLRGESFDALAREFSKDSLSAGKGGDLGFVKWGEKNFGAIFYNLIDKVAQGQISKIIESNVGFHIVKVEHIRSVKQLPYKESQERIQRSFYRPKNAELDSTYFAYIEQMKKKYKSEYIQTNIDSLLAVIKEKANEDVIPRREPLVFLNSLTPEQQKMPLANYEGGTFAVEQMFKIYNTISPMRRPAIGSTDVIVQFLDKNVPKTLIIEKGYSKKVHKNAKVKSAVKKEKEKILSQYAKLVLVDNRVDVSEEKMKSYYDEHLYKYETDVKVDVQQIKVSDLKTAKIVYEKADNGVDFLNLASKYYAAELNSKDAELGFISSTDHDLIGKTAVQMNVGDISEPLKIDAFYSVIKVVQRKAGSLSSYEKVKGKIIREFKRSERTTLQNSWMQNVRDSVPIIIYNDVLKREFGITD